MVKMLVDSLMIKLQFLYDKFAPFSFKKVREKTKQLGQEYTPRQYAIQVVIIGGFAGLISYLYFYNLLLVFFMFLLELLLFLIYLF